jgi:hypothetical protein
MFFLERKNQRTFSNKASAAETIEPSWIKVFLLFSSEKEDSIS